ncbi:poly-beta-1,6 N-acetyl-D-glucosamine synthase [Rubrivivax gelatinosus]|nr:poly-beta-1,6 N-acetyl-D-glucosamine synthase [Rubrivivax gelatinosus]
MEAWLLAVQTTAWYGVVLAFFAVYPIVTSLMWIVTALIFRVRWEETIAPDPNRPEADLPFVSVLVPAHNEAAVILRSVESMLRLDYPHYEVIVVDDGSTDGTLERLDPLSADPRLRLVRKACNEGKAMALNDAIALARGEILMGLDADAEPDPQMLRYIVPHFDSPRVAAVTGNPRVRNTGSFLARLQAVEFSSIVSLLRRAQRVWGRIVTVSGVVAALRRSAVLDVGGYSPDMPTEDIELTWRLQKRHYDVRYEPRALCWMTVPLSYRGLWRQRLRWARGLIQVLRKHADVIVTWRSRRLWPVFVESSLSILWSVCFVLLATLWTLSWAVGLPPVGASPIPNLWGMAIATLCLLQLAVGVWIDRRYDPGITRFLPYAVWYPLIYWAFLALTTVVALPTLLRRPAAEAVRWSTARVGRGS